MNTAAEQEESEILRPTRPLDAGGCWERLRAVEVGHLAVVIDGDPEIFPVNYVVDQESLMFRTADGSKLSAATQGRVAFEVDGLDAESGDAWSVVCKGSAHEVKDMDDLIDAAGLPLSPLNGAAKTRFVRIEVDQISGRQFPVADPAMWRNPFTLRRGPA